jgi:hypothetical protein
MAVGERALTLVATDLPFCFRLVGLTTAALGFLAAAAEEEVVAVAVAVVGAVIAVMALKTLVGGATVPETAAWVARLATLSTPETAVAEAPSPPPPLQLLLLPVVIVELAAVVVPTAPAVTAVAAAAEAAAAAVTLAVVVAVVLAAAAAEVETSAAAPPPLFLPLAAFFASFSALRSARAVKAVVAAAAVLLVLRATAAFSLSLSSLRLRLLAVGIWHSPQLSKLQRRHEYTTSPHLTRSPQELHSMVAPTGHSSQSSAWLPGQ